MSLCKAEFVEHVIAADTVVHELMRTVLFITPQPFFQERGSPYRVRAEIQALVAQGFDVHLLSYPMGRDTEIPGVTQFRSWKVPGIPEVPIGWSFRKLVLDISLFFKTLLLLCRYRYVAVHGVEDAGVMAAFLSVIFRFPYIFDMHSQMSEQLAQCVLKAGGPLHRCFSAVERWCMRRAAGIITVSDVITARVRGLAPLVPAMTLEDLALGCTESIGVAEVAALRSQHGGDEYSLAVYTGNFEPYQGIDLLLTGFAELLRMEASGAIQLERPPRLVLVGGGTDDDPRMKKYRRMAEELSLGARAVFVGQKNESEVGLFTAMADLLVSPRIAGAHTPLKIYTYMAAAKPIVATRIAAHTNVLHDGNAFLGEAEPAGFGTTFATAFAASAEALELRAAKVAEATALLEKRFSRAEFYRRMGVLYRAALGEHLSDEVLLSPETLELRQRQQSWS